MYCHETDFDTDFFCVFPNVIQTLCSPEEMLDRRLVVLKGIMESEEVYLSELEALLMVTNAH